MQATHKLFKQLASQKTSLLGGALLVCLLACTVCFPIYFSPSSNLGSISPNTKFLLVTSLMLVAILMLGGFFFLEHLRFLHKKIERQENTIAQRQALLSNLSHEIRTPLSGIIGMISLLEDSSTQQAKKETLESIKLASTHLLELVNNILDYSKLREGVAKQQTNVFNIKQLILNQFKILKIEAQRNKVEFELNISPKAQLYLKSDPTKISQILINLLSNAVKFSIQSKVVVDVNTFLQKNDSLLKLQVKVQDFGIGIEKSAQEKIFNPFTQAQTNTSHKYGGSGLGLAICSQICKLMKGHIWCTSALGKGSTFGFAIDVTKASYEDYLSSQDQLLDHHATPSLQLQLLLVEDDEVNLKVASSMLSKLGFNHEIARNGEQALDKAAATCFDIIFMDINLPLLDGFSAATKIKSANHHKNLKIVAMTARSLAEIENSLNQSGIDDYLLKPFSIDKLKEKISKYSQEHAKTATPSQKPSTCPH